MFLKYNPQMRKKDLRELKGAPLSVYICVASHMNWYGQAFPSLKTISEETNYSIRQVKRALQFLRERGFITPVRAGKWSSTVYQVNHWFSIGRDGDISEGHMGHVCPTKKDHDDSLFDTSENLNTSSSSSCNVSTLGDISDKESEKIAPEQGLAEELEEFGFWDAREFARESDPEIVQEAIEEVREIQEIGYDPERMRERMRRGQGVCMLRNPGGYLRKQVQRKMAQSEKGISPKKGVEQLECEEEDQSTFDSEPDQGEEQPSRLGESCEGKNEHQSVSSNSNMSSLAEHLDWGAPRTSAEEDLSKRKSHELWEEVKSSVKGKMARGNYETWIKDTKGLRFSDGTLVVGTPGDFFREHIERFLYPILLKEATDVLGRPVKLEFQADEDPG